MMMRYHHDKPALIGSSLHSIITLLLLHKSTVKTD